MGNTTTTSNTPGWNVSEQNGIDHENYVLPSTSDQVHHQKLNGKIGLRPEDIETIKKASSDCVLETNVIRRKHALQILVECLTSHSLQGLENNPAVLESLCLALSLNAVSTEDSMQLRALQGVRCLCYRLEFISQLLDKGLAMSICTLMKRDSTKNDALGLCLTIVRFIGLNHAGQIKHGSFVSFYDEAERIVRIGERLGKRHLYDALAIVSTFPMERVLSSRDFIWNTLVEVIVSSDGCSHDSNIVGFMARMALFGDDNKLDSTIANPALFQAMISQPSVWTRRTIAAASRRILPKDEYIVKLICRNVLDLIEVDSATIKEGLETVIFLSKKEFRAGRALMETGGPRAIEECIERFARDSLEIDKKFLVFSALVHMIVSSCALNDDLPSRSQLEYSKRTFEALGGEEQALGVKLLVSVQDAETVPFHAIESLLLYKDESAYQVAGLFMLLKRINKMGWLAGGFYHVGSGSLSEVMEREENQDVGEQQFTWHWKQDIVDCLVDLASNANEKVQSQLAAKILSLLVRVEGPDRRDGLEIHASFESSQTSIPVNLARPDLFELRNEEPPRLFASPRELRSCQVLSADQRLEFVRRSLLSDNINTGLGGFTVTIWLKQIQSPEEDSPKPKGTIRVIIGSVGDRGHPLILSEDVHLGFKGADGEIKRFGPWDQLSSGWHHLVIVCTENPHLAGVDLIMGRSHLLKCYVDGTRFGVPIPCTLAQCPKIEDGLVMGCSSNDEECLGEGFVLGEMRVFSTSLSERTVSASVARSSFNRRPNWNLSASSGTNRLTAPHIWARSKLAQMPKMTELVKQLVNSEDEVGRKIGLQLMYFLGTVITGSQKKALYGESTDQVKMMSSQVWS